MFVAATNHKLDEGCYFWTGTTWEERSDRSWQSPGFAQDDRHPVTCVDLNAAKAYVAQKISAAARPGRGAAAIV